MPKSNFLRFIVRYGTESKPSFFYWKNGIVFFLKDRTVFAECRQDSKQIVIQIQDADRALAYTLFQTLYEIDNSEKIEVSTNGVDFVNYKALKECQFEGLTYGGKPFKKEDFAFLWGNFTQKTPKNSPEAIIEKALHFLELAKVDFCFVEMDKIVIPSEFVYAYNELKQKFIRAKDEWNFDQQLATLLRDIKKQC